MRFRVNVLNKGLLWKFGINLVIINYKIILILLEISYNYLTSPLQLLSLKIVSLCTFILFLSITNYLLHQLFLQKNFPEIAYLYTIRISKFMPRFWISIKHRNLMPRFRSLPVVSTGKEICKHFISFGKSQTFSRSIFRNLDFMRDLLIPKVPLTVWGPKKSAAKRLMCKVKVREVGFSYNLRSSVAFTKFAAWVN